MAISPDPGAMADEKRRRTGRQETVENEAGSPDGRDIIADGRVTHGNGMPGAPLG
jgi:hypothetical protein